MRTTKDETPHEAHERSHAVTHVATHVAEEPKAARVSHVEHVEEAPASDEHVAAPKDETHAKEAHVVAEEEKPVPRVPRREAAKTDPDPPGPQQVSPAQIKVGDRLRLPDGNEVTAVGVLNTDNELLIQVREGGGWVNATGAALL